MLGPGGTKTHAEAVFATPTRTSTPVETREATRERENAPIEKSNAEMVKMMTDIMTALAEIRKPPTPEVELPAQPINVQEERQRQVELMTAKF